MTTNDPFLDDERLEIQATAHRFAMEEALPIANELDPLHEDIPPELIERMAELGYFGITVSDEYGGMGKGVFEYALIAEELARAWMSVASIIARAQGMGTQVGDESRRAELLRKISPAGPNLLVIQTAIGAAQRVALALDRCAWPEMIGNIGGDDTVFVATESALAQKNLIARIERSARI